MDVEIMKKKTKRHLKQLNEIYNFMVIYFWRQGIDITAEDFDPKKIAHKHPLLSF
jgi:hypothetical protein